MSSDKCTTFVVSPKKRRKERDLVIAPQKLLSEDPLNATRSIRVFMERMELEDEKERSPSTAVWILSQSTIVYTM